MPETDPRRIQAMFNRLAPAYDRFNCFSTLGLDGFWRRKAVRVVQPGMRVLDVGTGTGDLALLAARRLEGRGKVLGLDFSEPMLVLAQKKGEQQGLQALVEWRFCGIEDLPLGDGPFDAVLSGFVMRNLIENIRPILCKIREHLKPGGLVSFVDLTAPEGAFARTAGKLYLRTAVRFWGALFFKDFYPAGYLDRSMLRFFRAGEFAALLAESGFRSVRHVSYLGGLVTLYSGVK